MESRTYHRYQLFYEGRKFYVEFYYDGMDIEAWVQEEKNGIKLKTMTVPVIASVESVEDDLMEILVTPGEENLLASYIESFE